jgi:tetratricopeptide (TPR) repeat protein
MIQVRVLMQDPVPGRRFRHVLGLAFVLVAASMSAGAAEPTQAEINAAKGAFQAGLALEAASDYSHALAKFREVTAVKVTPHALFHIGRCLERLGKWTEAVGNYRLAVEKAEGSSEAAVRQQAEAARVALEPRLPRLTIDRGYGADTASISLDGVALGVGALGTAMPADPGPHVVTAELNGKQAFSLQVTVAEYESKSVKVELGTKPVAATSAKAVDTSDTQHSSRFSRTTGIIVLSGGLASFVAGVVLLGLRQNAVNQLDDDCNGLHCPDSSKDRYQSAKIYTVLGDVFLGIGLVGTGLGTYMVVKGKREQPKQSPPQARRVWVTPVGPSSLGASVGGTF